MTRVYDPDHALNGDSTSNMPRAAIARRLNRIRWEADGTRLIAAIRAGAHEDGLRATTLLDVAEQLQRHGHLLEVGTTDDGVIVGAAEACSRVGEIVIWTGYAIGNWHPSDIWTQGLGGSETAAWRLSEELAEMGYRVTLYGQFENEGVFGDIILRDFRQHDPSRYVDVFVSFRNARVFEQIRPNATTTLLWLEDLAGAHSEGLTPRNANHIDKVVTVSQWHKQHMLGAYPWLAPSQVVACRNGIDLSFFERDDIVREKRVVYSSSPDRGLIKLLELWPRVRKAVPDAELITTYSRWYDIVADSNPYVTENRKRINELADQPGVKRLPGGLGQGELAELMLSALVWVHPAWETIHDVEFNETSCISAMEAQAAGCVVVASNHGALTETVQVGTLVDGGPYDESWRDVFVQSIIQGLTDEKVQSAAQTAGPDAMRDMAWFGAAERLAATWVGRDPAPARISTHDRFTFQQNMVCDALGNGTGLILNIGCKEDPAGLKALDNTRVINCDLKEWDGIEGEPYKADRVFDCVLDEWPFEDGSADLVVMGDILEHLDYGEILVALNEARRVGRKLAITTPQDTRDSCGAHFADSYPRGERHRTCFTVGLLKELLEAAGWKITHLRIVDYVFLPVGFLVVAE